MSFEGGAGAREMSEGSSPGEWAHPGWPALGGAAYQGGPVALQLEVRCSHHISWFDHDIWWIIYVIHQSE